MSCKWIHVVLLLIIAVFAIFNIVAWSTAKWVIFIAALGLLLHALWCKSCNECWAGNHRHAMKEMPAKKKR
ncbi:MAG: hypothetical protein AABW51_03660 [Nanoarchaeota archaeon]